MSGTSTNQRTPAARAQPNRRTRRQATSETKNQQNKRQQNQQLRQQQIQRIRRAPRLDKNNNMSARDIRMAEKYALSLADPSSYMTRIPDADVRKTCLCQSVYDLPIQVNFSGNENDGRFSILAQPILGKDGTNVDTFKVALTQVGIPLDTDWSQPDAYQQIVGGYDIREDRYISQLTGTPAFFFGVAGGPGTSPAAPFGTAPLFDPLNYGSSLHATFDAGLGTNFTIHGGAGLFHLNIFFADSVSVFPLSGNATLSPTGENFNGAPPSSADVIINATGNWSVGPITATLDPGTPALTITPVSTLGNTSWQNAGAVSQIRPVAMSMLFTSSLPSLTNGGNIAAACLPAATCAPNFFTNVSNSAVGQLQDWASLGAIDGNYSGNLREGAYCYYVPDDPVINSHFNNPEAANRATYPCLLISGQMATPAGMTPGVYLAGRVLITTTYEFTSNTRLWEHQSLIGSTDIYEQGLNFLCREPRAMKNGEHLEWLRRLALALVSPLKQTARFIYDNRDTIGPLAAKAAALALA